MSIFAGYAAQAMANATSYGQLLAQSAELERRADSQRRLLEINERLLATLDHAGVLETIADGLHGRGGLRQPLDLSRRSRAAACCSRSCTREHHADEVSRYVIPFGRGLMGWAVEHMQPILANDALSDPRALQIPGTPDDPEAVVVVPLIADGEVLGALNVSRVGGPGGVLQRQRLRARPALRRAGVDRAAQRRRASRREPARRHRCAHRPRPTTAPSSAISPTASRRPRPSGRAGTVTAFSVLMMDLDSVQGLQRSARPSRRRRAPAPRGQRDLRRGAQRRPRLPLRRRRVHPHPPRHRRPSRHPGSRNRVRRAVAALTDGDPAPVTITIGVAALPSRREQPRRPHRRRRRRALLRQALRRRTGSCAPTR